VQGPDASCPGPGHVLLNDGAGGLAPSVSIPPTGCGVSAQVTLSTDRDGDGDADVLWPNNNAQRGRMAFLRNDGLDGGGLPQLVDDAADLGADLQLSGMGVDTTDWNGDGALDYCITDVGPLRCLASSSAGYVESAASLGLVPGEPALDHPGPTTLGWSFDFVDLDFDGWLDGVQASGPDWESAEAGDLLWPDLVWQGGEEGWTDVSEEVGIHSDAPHYGVSTADFDGDGWTDLTIAGPGAPPELWMNRCGEAAWTQVELRGPGGNPDAYGARIEVTAAGRTIVRERYGLRAGGQSGDVTPFGLGAAETYDLRVIWPDGERSERIGLPARRRVTVTHPSEI
jgi:hypothetical protein